MKTIWKFKFSAASNEIELPADAQVLTVQLQNGTPCLWALVDQGATSKVKRKFKIYGTGHDMPDNPGKYIGTFLTDGGCFVWHVFEDFFKITYTTKESGVRHELCKHCGKTRLEHVDGYCAVRDTDCFEGSGTFVTDDKETA